MKAGKIKISRTYINDVRRSEISDLYLVFNQFIPVYIQDNPMDEQLIYWGYSNQFDDIKEGEVVPLYDVILTTNDTGATIEFKRLP